VERLWGRRPVSRRPGFKGPPGPGKTPAQEGLSAPIGRESALEAAREWRARPEGQRPTRAGPFARSGPGRRLSLESARPGASLKRPATQPEPRAGRTETRRRTAPTERGRSSIAPGTWPSPASRAGACSSSDRHARKRSNRPPRTPSRRRTNASRGQAPTPGRWPEAPRSPERTPRAPPSSRLDTADGSGRVWGSRETTSMRGGRSHDPDHDGEDRQESAALWESEVWVLRPCHIDNTFK
jgi:hypothetical protein